MIARVRRWGNSLAIRLRKSDAAMAGVSEGDLVRVTILRIAKGRGLDLSTLPTIADPDPTASVNHDRYVYGPRS
jgi:hypothetical protein